MDASPPSPRVPRGAARSDLAREAPAEWPPEPAPQLTPALPSGLIIGAYTVIGLLARGGMAEIYLALARSADGHERPVVIKRVLSDLPEHDDPALMFADEAALSARLHHPNLVQVLDVVESEAGLLIVLEHLHGADALEVLHSCDRLGRRVPLDVAAQVVGSVCVGLHHAHELRSPRGEPLHVVHRDVSPQNLFLGFDGDVKLLDFGLARSVGRAAITRTGVAKGRLGYFSPEQVMSRPIDRRTDIFSLGIVLYELSLGVKLYDLNRGELTIVREIVEGRIRPPREIDPAYPARLEAVVMRALAKRPDERFPTAYAFARELMAAARASGLSPSAAAVRRFMADLYPDRVVDAADPDASFGPALEGAPDPAVVRTDRVEPLPRVARRDRRAPAPPRRLLVSAGIASVGVVAALAILFAGVYLLVGR